MGVRGIYTRSFVHKLGMLHHLRWSYINIIYMGHASSILAITAMLFYSSVVKSFTLNQITCHFVR